jgi:tetratricopeptide (TPR) repeat protein
MIWSRSLLCLLALISLHACKPDAEGADALDPEHVLQDRESLSPEVAAHVDSGSVAFRSNDLEGALMHYERATDLDPDFGAAWFGVYMVERARGNTEEAEEALARAQKAMPDASLIHPESADTTR